MIGPELSPTIVVAAAIVAGVLGLAIGSFLNVVVWRLPRGESLSRPPSACPKCGHPIRARDNVPVVSWLVLRGRCRDCGQPIAKRYPLVELGTAIAFVLVVLWAAQQPAGFWLLPAFGYFAAVSVALALIDLDTRTLPNRIVLPSLLVAVLLLAVASLGTGQWWALLWAIVGSAALFLFYFALVLVYPKGMGFGDVKLAALLGLYLGWVGWDALVVGAFAAFLFGGLFSIGLVVFRKAGRSTAIPFGPWMLLGTWVGLALGRDIAQGYLTLVGLRS